jgi:hypothetical protein
MAEVDFKPVRAGLAFNVDSIIRTLKLSHLDKETLLDLMFIKEKEGKSVTFFSHFSKELTETATSHKDFMQVYEKFSSARKKQNEVLMEEAISEYKNLASSVDSKEPAQRNP